MTLESAALEEKHREKLSEVDLAWSEKIEDLREKDRVAREGEEVERKKFEEERRTFEEERRRYQDEIEGLKAERAEAREAERSRAGEARDELEQVQRELRSTVGDLEELKKRYIFPLRTFPLSLLICSLAAAITSSSSTTSTRLTPTTSRRSCDKSRPTLPTRKCPSLLPLL